MGMDMTNPQWSGAGGGYQSAYPSADGTNIPMGYQQQAQGTTAMPLQVPVGSAPYGGTYDAQHYGYDPTKSSADPNYQAPSGPAYWQRPYTAPQQYTSMAQDTAPGYQTSGTTAFAPQSGKVMGGGQQPSSAGYQMQGPATGQQPMGKTNQSAPQLGQQYGAQTLGLGQTINGLVHHPTSTISDFLHSTLPGLSNQRSANASDNWLQAINHDALHNLSTPGGMMPTTTLQNMAKDHRAWQGQRRDARNNAQNGALNAQDDWMNNANLTEGQKLLDYQTKTDSARTDALNNINAGYANREPTYQDAYNSQLAASNANAAAQYQTGTQNEGLQMAAAGRLGSSTDAEHQADLANTYRTQVIGGQNSAQDYAQALRDADYQQQNSLQRAALSGDPATAAGYQALASGATSNAQNLAGQQQLQQQQIGLQNQYGMAQSQQLGGLGNALAGGVQSYYGVYGGA